MRKAIDDTARLNRASGIARVPQVAADVLRALDHDGLLGKGILIVGTHALYAYEARSGIIFQPELLATGDLGLLADIRSRLVLAIDDKKREGILPALRRAVGDRRPRRAWRRGLSGVDPVFALSGDHTLLNRWRSQLQRILSASNPAIP